MTRTATDDTRQSNPITDLRIAPLASKHPGRGSWRSLLQSDFQFLSSKNGISGWIRRDAPRELDRLFAAAPETFITSSRARILRDRPKSKLYRCILEASDGTRRSLLVKRVHYASPFRRLGFLFTASPALRSLRGALILQQKGLDTPLPMAAIELRSWKQLGTSYYVAEEIEDSQSLRALWQTTVPGIPRTRTFQMRRGVLRVAASLFHRLHSLGIFHQDLKGTNILIRNSECCEPRLFLVDVGDVREPRHLLWQKKVRNLVQICEIPGRFWTQTEKAFFLKRYSDLCGLSKAERHALVHDVLRTTAALTRRDSQRRTRRLFFGQRV